MDYVQISLLPPWCDHRWNRRKHAGSTPEVQSRFDTPKPALFRLLYWRRFHPAWGCPMSPTDLKSSLRAAIPSSCSPADALLASYAEAERLRSW